MSYLNALRNLEHSALRYQLLLVRGEAHDGPGREVEHARQRETGLRQVGDGADVVVDRCDLVLRFRRGRRFPALLLAVGGWLRASLLAAGLAPAHRSVIAERVLEALASHRSVVVRPSDRLALHRVGSHEIPPCFESQIRRSKQKTIGIISRIAREISLPLRSSYRSVRSAHRTDT